MKANTLIYEVICDFTKRAKCSYSKTNSYGRCAFYFQGKCTCKEATAELLREVANQISEVK